MPVTLRAQSPEDLPLLTGGESPFDAFWPRAPRTTPSPTRLDDDSGGLAVLDDIGELAGDVSWHWTRWGPSDASRCPEIGIWLRPTHRGRGIGTLAQAALAALFFAHTAVHRVQASTDVENVAEQRALAGAGFTREGRARGAQWREGARHDMYLYARLRDDPPGAAA